MWMYIVIFTTVFGTVFGRSRLLNSYDTNIKQHPFQISLQYDGSHYCGGFLISNLWAITAASCVNEVDMERLNVRAGSTWRSQGGQRSRIAEIRVHPNFKGYHNNIALLHFSSEIRAKRAKPAILPEEDNLIIGSPLIISGWGRRNYFDKYCPEILQSAQTTVLDNKICEELFGHSFDSNSIFCTSLPDDVLNSEEENDSYEVASLRKSHRRFGAGFMEDTGGPAVQDDTVVGVIFMHFYTKVFPFRDWIKNVTDI